MALSFIKQKIRLKEVGEGLILEADLEYPEHLHDLHDYPLGVEKVRVTEEMLSLYSREIMKKYNISVGFADKLIPTLGKKEKYVLYYKTFSSTSSLV